MDAISVELGIPFITHGCASRIIRTIVELLLYNRTQIPFPYTTFRAMVKKLEPVETTENGSYSVAELRIQKRREKAQRVVECVELAFDTIEKVLSSDHPAIRQMMIVFGKTIYTAKEAFTIILPAIDQNHYGENHQRSLEKVLRKIGLQLTLCDSMASDQATTGDTNVYLMVKSPSTVHPRHGLNLVDNFQLPKKCAKYVINLKTTNIEGDAMTTDCCKRIEIFSEEVMDPSCAPAAAQETYRVMTPEPEISSSNDWFLLDAVISGFSTDSVKETIWK